MSVVSVNCENLHSNPYCPHGPMVKFTKVLKGSPVEFFGCSACRDPKECPFSLRIGETFSESKLRAIADARKLLGTEKCHRSYVATLSLFKSLPLENRQFCKTCCELVLPGDSSHRCHELIANVSDEMLEKPLQLIAAKTDNRKEAQYWFDDRTIEFVVSLVQDLDCDGVLCLGTPSVFEQLKSAGVKCLFLDIDARYRAFYNEKEFGWFNMMNFHFLSEKKRSMNVLKKFMKCGKIGVFVDPPFGVRLEILAPTIQNLRSLGDDVVVFLALPYFMEPRVKESLSDFDVLDYVVHYDNHPKMRSHKKSAVRFFTNVAPSSVRLPTAEGYKFCVKCSRWRHHCNVHCNACGTCPSKNASPYKHCSSCRVCVKSTWEHCSNCGRCFLAPHKCDDNPLLKRRNHDRIKRRKKRRKT